jgi:hypothetical protein
MVRKLIDESGLGRVIARRTLTEITPDEMREVVVTIGAPRRCPDGHWKCPFLIKGRAPSRIQNAGGVDGLQALLSAVEGVWANLERTGNRFQWLSPQSGSGIPRQVPMGYGRHFEERINRAIERETARHWQTMLKTRKADIAACEAELKHRKSVIAAWEAALVRRKTVAVAWEAKMKADKSDRMRKRQI